MNHFLERTRRKNLVMDAQLLGRLEEEAAQVKRPVSEVIQGRIRASYDAEIGEEARIWEALHQLQRDMERVLQGQARLMHWLDTLGVFGEGEAPEAEGDVQADTSPPPAGQTAAEFYQQVIPQGASVIEDPTETIAPTRRWFRRGT